jgi:hypothetical protein
MVAVLLFKMNREHNMDIEKVKKTAEEARNNAKQKFGEAIGQTGYLNPKLPISQFVEAVINAAILEVAIMQHEAMNEPQ